MKKVILTLAAALSLSLGLIACGNSGGGGSSSTASTATCGSTAGYVQTQYGCLPEYNGNPNYGNYNGVAVPVTSGYTYGNGVYPYGAYSAGTVYPQTPYPYYNYNYNYQSGIYNNTVYPNYYGSPGLWYSIRL